MPARNPELPEGTDHIINGAMETGAGSDASTGSSGGSGGFVGGGAGGNGGDDTGGATLGAGTTVTYSGATGGGNEVGGTGGGGGASGGGSDGSGGGSGDGGSGAPIKQQLRDGVDNVRQQAGDKIRTYALTGKDKATTALDDLSQVVNDAATQIDERLGAQYGDYARRAAGAVTDFADTLRNKEVDELFDDAREIVRKSPGIAIGAAAVVGFTLVRLIKAGLDETGSSGGGNVNFKPEGGRNIDFEPAGGSGSGSGA
ncbi:MAG TPA: hypothetical protein VF662_07515 [Allosphingosinicella sp.]|jgi:ElaB/YqjD/DUF883 family membrane-anchored ribosome-binding protein